jgi:hypothetical protein
MTNVVLVVPKNNEIPRRFIQHMDHPSSLVQEESKYGAKKSPEEKIS